MKKTTTSQSAFFEKFLMFLVGSSRQCCRTGFLFLLAWVIASSNALAQAPALAVTVTPDTAFQAMFESYGNDNTLLDDWTGADSTLSVLLPDGRVVWNFSDTFLGFVNSD